MYNKEMKVQAECPFCGSAVITTVEWAMKNGRLFCDTCCKSFPVATKEAEKQKDEGPNYDKDGLSEEF